MYIGGRVFGVLMRNERNTAAQTYEKGIRFKVYAKSDLPQLNLLELGKEHLESLGALTEVADGHGGALEVLLDVALGVTLHETSPLGQLGALLNHDDVDVVDLAESLDELLVTGILAVGGKDAEVGAAAVEGASDLRQSADQTVGLEGLAHDDAKGVLGGLGGHVLLDGGGYNNNGGLVRHGFARKVLAHKNGG